MKIKHLIISLVLALASGTAAHAEGALGIDGEEATSVGLYIKNIATGEVLVEHNSKLALTPASVTKAVTTASALSLCGADTSFTTTVVLQGTREGAVLHGNLVVRSAADPTLESENFKARRGFADAIASRLADEGITDIEGTIVVEETLSGAGPIPQWEIEDVAWPYGAALHGFNWRDNTVTLFPATGRTEPEAPGLEICLERAKSNDILRGAFSDRLLVWTRDPNDTKWSINVSVPDPAAVFVAELTRKLRAKDIKVGDTPLAPSGDTTLLYRHSSAPFGEIMRSLMVRSDNLFAEGMLRAIAPGASRGAAIAREKSVWKSRGIDAKYTIINDGSGLTRANRLSPRFLGDVLEWMAKSEWADDYTAFFPRAGRDGTLRGFLADSPLKGRIALKTGSVSSVQCYAGYRLDAEGKPTHVVVMMVNGFFCPRKEVRKACEALLEKTFPMPAVKKSPARKKTSGKRRTQRRR